MRGLRASLPTSGTKKNGPGIAPGAVWRSPRAVYCTVMASFIPNATWGTQYALYVPFGAFAKEIS